MMVILMNFAGKCQHFILHQGCFLIKIYLDPEKQFQHTQDKTQNVTPFQILLNGANKFKR